MPVPEPTYDGKSHNGDNGWLPAVDEPARTSADAPAPVGGSPDPSTSTEGTHRRVASDAISSYTVRDGGSTFANGAGTTGPLASAEPSADLRARGAEADAALTPKQRSRISKSEAKSGRELSKIIKQEEKTEKKALAVAVRELGELQAIQKAAVKREEIAHTTHSKALAAFQKHEAAFLAARARHDAAQAALAAETDALEVSRSNARAATEALQDKSQEVERLRTVLSVDTRERQVKLQDLHGGSSRCW